MFHQTTISRAINVYRTKVIYDLCISTSCSPIGAPRKPCEKRGFLAPVQRASMNIDHITNRRTGGGSAGSSVSFSYTSRCGVIGARRGHRRYCKCHGRRSEKFSWCGAAEGIATNISKSAGIVAPCSKIKNDIRDCISGRTCRSERGVGISSLGLVRD